MIREPHAFGHRNTWTGIVIRILLLETGSTGGEAAVSHASVD